MLRILRGLGGDSASLQSWRNFRHALAEFCGRVPTHFAHNQKDWTGKDITVKGEEDKQTVSELQKPFHDHFGLTRPRPKYDNADHELVSNVLASLDLMLNTISHAANSHSGILWSCPHTLRHPATLALETLCDCGPDGTDVGLSRPCAKYDNTNGKFAHGRAESFYQFAFYHFYISNVRRLCGVASTPSTPPTPNFVTVFTYNLAE